MTQNLIFIQNNYFSGDSSWFVLFNGHQFDIASEIEKNIMQSAIKSILQKTNACNHKPDLRFSCL